jgi:hypothetical protein
VSTRRRRISRTAAVLALAAGSVGVAGAARASVTPDNGLVFTGGHWAAPATATIHPGVMTTTDKARCTANFLYTDGHRTYLGQAAHCSGTGEATETNGCSSTSLPLGTPVRLDSSDVVGTMVYNSWTAMQAAGEKDHNACAHNDLALIRLPDSAVSQVNPSIPVFGGPVGLNTTGTRAGEQVSTYGNSPLRQGISLLSPKAGTSLGDSDGGWSHAIYTVTPGIPGDSGSAVLDSEGRALGDLSTLELAPLPGANQVSDLAHELVYARAHGMKHLQLVSGTEPFIDARTPSSAHGVWGHPGPPIAPHAMIGGGTGLLGGAVRPPLSLVGLLAVSACGPTSGGAGTGGAVAAEDVSGSDAGFTGGPGLWACADDAPVATVVRQYTHAPADVGTEHEPAGGTALLCGTPGYGYRHILARHQGDWSHVASTTDWSATADAAVAAALGQPERVGYRASNNTFCYSHGLPDGEVTTVVIRPSDGAIITAYPGTHPCDEG